MEHLCCLVPKSSKTARLLTNWSMYLDLDPLSQMIPKQTFWSLQTTPSEGFGIRGLSKRHLPQGVVFPGLSKRHPPRRLGLLGMYIRRTSRPCLPSLSKRHPPRGSGPFSKWVQNRAKKYPTWRGTIFFFKQPLPRVFCLLNEPLRGFGGPTVAIPRTEGGGGEAPLPPQSLLLRVLTRRTEGRRIFM